MGAAKRQQPSPSPWRVQHDLQNTCVHGIFKSCPSVNFRPVSRCSSIGTSTPYASLARQFSRFSKSCVGHRSWKIDCASYVPVRKIVPTRLSYTAYDVKGTSHIFCSKRTWRKRTRRENLSTCKEIKKHRRKHVVQKSMSPWDLSTVHGWDGLSHLRTYARRVTAPGSTHRYPQLLTQYVSMLWQWHATRYFESNLRPVLTTSTGWRESSNILTWQVCSIYFQSRIGHRSLYFSCGVSSSDVCTEAKLWMPALADTNNRIIAADRHVNAKYLIRYISKM